MDLKAIIGRQDYMKVSRAGWPSYDAVLAGMTSADPDIARDIKTFVDKKLAEYHRAMQHGNFIAEHNQRYQQQVFFDKKYKHDVPCLVPWNTMGVTMSGDVFICLSPAWIPRFVGNVLTAQDVYADILNSVEAQKIRQEILNNRYYYCNNFLCSHFLSVPQERYVAHATDDASLSQLSFEPEHSYQINDIPRNLIFDFDDTCNFRCPSCRTQVINKNKHHIIRPINEKIVDKIKTLVINNIGDQPIEIRWAGGEPFISEVYVNLMQYIIDTGKTNIKHIIQTNGSYLKSKSHLVSYLLPHMKELRISFDAATADTYHRVRVNGRWDSLLDNVRWVIDSIKNQNAPVRVTADFVVQEDNYKEIPDFAELCNDLGIQNINYQKMWNWNTWPEDELRQRSVWHEAHPKYQLVVDLINQAKSMMKTWDT